MASNPDPVQPLLRYMSENHDVTAPELNHSPEPPRPGRIVPGLRKLENEDAKRDWIVAKLNTQRACSVAVIVAALDLLAAILYLCGVQILDTNLWILFDVGLVLGLAYGIRRFSRVCAVLMCIYYLGSFIHACGKNGLLGIIIWGIFLYYFCRGAQAVFTYHRLKRLGYKETT
jgi:hypothetical protein